jgi:predicted transcriptional regulator
MADTLLSLRQDLVDGLDELAAGRGKTRAEIAEEAVGRYLEYERWFMERVDEGVRQADAGEFATDDEVDQVFNKYRTRAAAA